MINFILESTKTDILDISTIKEKARINGDTIFIIKKFDSTEKYFSTSKVEIKRSSLPLYLEEMWQRFNEDLISYISADRNKERDNESN